MGPPVPAPPQCVRGFAILQVYLLVSHHTDTLFTYFPRALCDTLASSARINNNIRLLENAEGRPCRSRSADGGRTDNPRIFDSSSLELEELPVSVAPRSRVDHVRPRCGAPVPLFLAPQTVRCARSRRTQMQGDHGAV
jgi:hypothetical protein